MSTENIEMNKVKAIFSLIRVKQWYKSVLIFVGVLFGGELFNFSNYPKLILGFFLISLVSSMNYIQNDIRDIEKDRVHPEKFKKRPLANGSLSPKFAWTLYILIGIIEIIYIVYFHNLFSLMLVTIFINGFLYNYVFKKIAFADILALSMIYIWRALAGCFIINITISNWLYILVFLAALFLATAKRIADYELLGDDASKHKEIYDIYSLKMLDYIFVIVATSLFLCYLLYCLIAPLEGEIFGNSDGQSIMTRESANILVYSMPFALFIIFRMMYLTHAKPEIARDASKIIRDKGIVVGFIFAAIIILIGLYFIGDMNDFFSRIFDIK